MILNKIQKGVIKRGEMLLHNDVTHPSMGTECIKETKSWESGIVKRASRYEVIVA